MSGPTRWPVHEYRKALADALARYHRAAADMLAVQAQKAEAEAALHLLGTVAPGEFTQGASAKEAMEAVTIHVCSHPGCDRPVPDTWRHRSTAPICLEHEEEAAAERSRERERAALKAEEVRRTEVTPAVAAPPEDQEV